MIDKIPEYKEKINEKILPIVQEKGYDIFDLKIFYASKKMNFRFLCDYEFGGINIDECAKLSREVDALMLELGIVAEDEAYVLEVSSPGLDHELKEYKDFLRVKGQEVMLWLDEKVDDKDHFEGKVLGADEAKEKLLLELKDKTIEIPAQYLRKGKVKLSFK